MGIRASLDDLRPRWPKIKPWRPGLGSYRNVYGVPARKDHWLSRLLSGMQLCNAANILSAANHVRLLAGLVFLALSIDIKRLIICVLIYLLAI